MNEFLTATTQGDTTTENGAIANSSTGSVFLDDFGKAGTYRDRNYLDVAADMSAMWARCPLTTLKSMFYLRAITRKPRFKRTQSEHTLRGQGAKDEFLKRMLWVAYEHPKVFIQNLWLIPVVGSYRDLWQLMFLDTSINNRIDRKRIYKEMIHDLADNTTTDLFRKYMPIPKTISKQTTDRSKALNTFAREFRDFCLMSNKDFRIMKAGGKAHSWQQHISNKRYKDIEWGKIPGIALKSLVDSKFLNNQGLDDEYLKWVESQPVLKFTGYPHELAKGLWENNDLSTIRKFTYDKQFQGLIEKGLDAGGITGNVWCALDTSGSMERKVAGGSVSAIDVCISLGIYFSALNTGAFKDHIIMFDSESRVKKLAGTFTEKIQSLKRESTAWGDTNFMSVIDEIVRIKTTRPEIPIEDYPTTLLVVSDMQFNPSEEMHRINQGVGSTIELTNYQAAVAKLKDVGLPDINIIWWQVTSAPNNVPINRNDTNTALLSGFDGSVITSILGGEVTKDGEPIAVSPETTFLTAINQEILNLIKI